MKSYERRVTCGAPMKVVLGCLITLSFVQWMAKAAILEGLQTIKGRKKKRRENI